ncbi:flagellar hook-associated protein FlgK [Aurantiacibacter luteus]|uniref:Flagellar hook-associated protein 1 n=1 Tax=Aurantiacibacter luteus TaxID=1581420 RepID=A0A0G9MPN7_9SPHN|nr:flagellar hook-associated protein FlgK [Aurantiacibacter luteus]KLE31258.1 hypothetical protein AAW00_13920 [Aurantiacibacter luteus]
MSGNLILIGRSGANAARAALETTAQNIANADNPTYARRTLAVSEVAATGGIGTGGSAVLSGVRVDRVQRTQSLFLQTEVRRTSSDIARADAELQGLRDVESVLEGAEVYPAITRFEASLSRLRSDPLDSSLRADALEAARTMVQTFGIADHGLAISGDEMRFAAADGLAQVNTLAGELARVNIGLARAQDGSVSKVALLDRRDALLTQMAGEIGISTTFDAVGRVTVRLVDAGGPVMVAGDSASAISQTVDADGTLSFALDGTPFFPLAGALAGRAQALERITVVKTELDGVAALLIAQVNGAQAIGATPTGARGGPMFSGTGAGDIALVMAQGSDIATAPAGSPAFSRDIGNLESLIAALAGDGPAKAADTMLFGLSSAIGGRQITRDALRSIADTASIALATETGVDLDNEAANLLRFQQAFQANGRVIQVAADIFDTLLGVR